MKLILLTIISAIYSLQANAITVTLHEEDLPRMVKENNSLVQADQKRVESTSEKTGHLARSFIPKVSLQAGQESFKYVTSEYRRQPYYGASAEFNIYNGGRDQYKSKIIELELEKDKSSQKINLFHQLEQARKTYWKAIYLQELLSKYDKSLQLIKTNRNAALKRIRGGVATQSDKFEFDIKEVEIQQDKKKVQLEFAKLTGHLKVLLGIQQEYTLVINQKLAHNHNWQKLLKHSEDDHNYLNKPYELNVKSVDLEAKLANRKWLPKLDAYALWLQNNQRADIDRVNEDERQQTAFGLRVTWNISDIVSGSRENKSAEILSIAKKMKLDFQNRELENELHMELKELELLDSMVHEAEENITRSQKFFNMITAEYKRGIKTSGDMLMATEKLISSEIRMMSIIKDFHLAKAHIMTKLGE